MDSDLDGWIDFPGKRLDCRDKFVAEVISARKLSLT